MTNANIKLKAILRAYSKAPFYNDFVRDIYSQENVTPGVQYVRVYNELHDENGNVISGKYTGEWVALDVALLEKPLEEFKNQVAELQEDVDAIDVSVDLTTNKLKFTKGNTVTYHDLPSAKVDYKTININENYRLYAVDTPDDKTLVETNIVYENGVDENGQPIPNQYGVVSKISGKVRAQALYFKEDPTLNMYGEELSNFKSNYITGFEIKNKIDEMAKNIKDLEAYTQGIGGFLDPYNFGNIGKDLQEDKNNILTQYAYDQLSNGVPQLIPDQTKVKNIFDGHIWVYIQADDNWIDEGADTVVQANNEGVIGAVTGSYDKFKAHINNDGTISINELEEEFNKVVYIKDTSVDPIGHSYVKRTSTGQIKAETPIDPDDVVNLAYVTATYDSNRITDEMIDSLFENNGGNN